VWDVGKRISKLPAKRYEPKTPKQHVPVENPNGTYEKTYSKFVGILRAMRGKNGPEEGSRVPEEKKASKKKRKKKPPNGGKTRNKTKGRPKSFPDKKGRRRELQSSPCQQEAERRALKNGQRKGI